MNAKYDVEAKLIGNVVRTLLEMDAKKVTAYVSPRLTVKASRVLFAGKIDKRDARADVVVTVGVPNYEERRFIKAARAANEHFPVRKLQIKMPPERRAA